MIEFENHHFNLQLLRSTGKDLGWTLKPLGDRLGSRAVARSPCIATQTTRDQGLGRGPLQ